MKAFDKAWKLLKGNPDARVQVQAGGYFSSRDFPIHPAALGAANRQVMAENENRNKLRNFAQTQGQEIPKRTLQDVSRQMVTPEQRARMENNSFDLKYKHPRFVSRTKSATNLPKTTQELIEQKRAKRGARMRRYERGVSNDGRPLHHASNNEQKRARHYLRHPQDFGLPQEQQERDEE